MRLLLVLTMRYRVYVPISRSNFFLSHKILFSHRKTLEQVMNAPAERLLAHNWSSALVCRRDWGHIRVQNSLCLDERTSPREHGRRV